MKLLLYCVKAKPYLIKNRFSGLHYLAFKELEQDVDYAPQLERMKFNGKIVAECDFEVEKITYDWYPCNILPKWDHYYTYYRTNKIEPKEFYEKSCLNWEQLNGYLNDYDSQSFEGGYAIHIKNLHIFDKPRELSFYYQKYKKDKHLYNIEKAPQNMMRAIGKQGDNYILISIKPEWLCKILNGEKTVEVRKKVLKEMLE